MRRHLLAFGFIFAIGFLLLVVGAAHASEGIATRSSYNTVQYLKQRHGLSDDLAKGFAAVEAIVDATVK